MRKKWKHSFPDVLPFVAKLAIFSAIWFTVDHFLLGSGNLIDRQLNGIIVSTSVNLLELLGFATFSYDFVFGVAGTSGLEIIDACNALTIMALFSGLLFAFPGYSMRKILFIFFGILIIHCMNIIRVVGLAYIQAYHFSYFPLVHDKVSINIFYGVVFVLWMIWIHKETQEADPSYLEHAAA